MTGALTTDYLPLEGLHRNSVIGINDFPHMNFAVSLGNIAVKQTFMPMLLLAYDYPKMTVRCQFLLFCAVSAVP